jgi:single-strand DNA-binding protein
MATVNKVLLIGNLTRDPELRYTPQGSAVCEFALALNHSYTNKQSGQKVEEVSFIDVVAWARTAEICAEYLKKGRQVFVEGRLKQDRWESPEGKKMNKIRVIAENVQFLGAKPGAGGPAGAEPPADAPADAAPPPDPDVPF